MLFVWARRFGSFPGGLTMLETTTEPPPDALEWRRIEMRAFLLFVPKKMRLPDELRLQIRGRFHPRIDALWNGCIYVV